MRMHRKTIPLSRTLSNGRLAVLSRSFMERYVRQRLARWYPDRTLRTLRIRDDSIFLFKKTIEYTLRLRSRDGAEETHIVRGSMPSLDTTREARVANRAMRAIWSVHRKTGRLPISRPLGFDEQLRILFYEAVPGVSLTHSIRHHEPHVTSATQQAGGWLARLHAAKIAAGHRRTWRRDAREAHYFMLNFKARYPSCIPEAARLLSAYLVVRKALEEEIQKNAVLIHGDFNPDNLIIRPDGTIAVIDFGNAWRYDPMSDLANAIVQTELLEWSSRPIPRATLQRLRQEFLIAYELRRRLTRAEQRRLHLFLIWWSLQSLSYIVTINVVTNPTLVAAALRRARRAFRTL